MTENKNFMLIHYASDNTYEIKQDHNHAFKNKKAIKVEFGKGQWFAGNICYGSEIFHIMEVRVNVKSIQKT